MKKVLVCGGTGFMGRNIVEYFSKQETYEVHYVHYRSPSMGHIAEGCFYSLPNVTSWKCDLTTQEGVDHVFKDGNFDIVIQAAANTSGAKDIIERPYLHVTDNAVMNSLILQACYDYNVKHFLFLSCGVMYDPDKSPVRESDFSLDDGIFKDYFGVGWTKVYVEKMCEFFSRLGRTKHTVIRHSNTYGPYDKYDLEKSHMFGATVNKVMSSNDGDEITVWGDGSTERDLLYVSDVVDFIHKAIDLQSGQYDLYNAGYGKSISVKDIVEKIIFHSGKRINIKFDKSKPSINTKLALNSEKALNDLSWSPKVSIDEGIKKTLNWYRMLYYRK